MKIAAVILNWCDAESTIHCVASLLGRSVFSGPVYVVDNASPDHSYELLRERLPQCLVVRNSTNSGYTGGNNHGMRLAFDDGCDAVLILNNDIDAHFTPAFWSWLEATISSFPRSLIGIPVSRSVSADDFSFPAPHGRVTRSIVEAAGVDLRQMPKLICGCAMVVTRELSSSVGLFNESFFMYCEEFEYAIRAALAQGRLTHSPPELGFVVRSESSGDRAPYVFYYQARNLMTIVLRSAGNHRMKTTLMVVLVSLLNAFRTRAPINVKATVWGVVHGFLGKPGRWAAAHAFRSK